MHGMDRYELENKYTHSLPDVRPASSSSHQDTLETKSTMLPGGKKTRFGKLLPVRKRLKNVTSYSKELGLRIKQGKSGFDCRPATTFDPNASLSSESLLHVPLDYTHYDEESSQFESVVVLCEIRLNELMMQSKDMNLDAG